MAALNEDGVEVGYAIEHFVHRLERSLVISQALLPYIRWTPHNYNKASISLALRLVVERFGELQVPVEEVFVIGKNQRGLNRPPVFLVSLAVIAGNNCSCIHACGDARLLVAKVFADPHVQQPLERREGVICALVGFPRFGYLLGRHIREFANAPHELRGVEQVGELVAEEVAAERVLHFLDAAADERVAALHVVVEERKRRPECETVKPQAHLGQFDGHGVEVYTVNTTFQHVSLEQVDIGQLAHVYGHALALHLLLYFTACLSQLIYNRVPPEGGQEFRHLVGDIVNSLNQEVTAAHGRVQDLQVEERFVDYFYVFFVCLVFRADIRASQRFYLVTLGFQGLLGIAEGRAQGLELLLQYRADCVLDDVLDDVVRGVIAAAGFAFAAVVLKVDLAFGVCLSEGIFPTPFFDNEQLLLPHLDVGHNLLCLLALDDGHHLWRDAQLEFKQTLVDAAQLAYSQALVVDEDQVVPLLVEIARHAVETQS